jgi:hypothetical protein
MMDDALLMHLRHTAQPRVEAPDREAARRFANSATLAACVESLMRRHTSSRCIIKAAASPFAMHTADVQIQFFKVSMVLGGTRASRGKAGIFW